MAVQADDIPFLPAFSSHSLPGPSASEVATLWRYTNLFIIIIIIVASQSADMLPSN